MPLIKPLFQNNVRVLANSEHFQPKQGSGTASNGLIKEYFSVNTQFFYYICLKEYKLSE